MFTLSCTRNFTLGAALLSSVLAFAQTPQLVVGYYQESSAFPLTNLVTNQSVNRLTHLNYAFGQIYAMPNDTYKCAPFDPAGELGPDGVFQQIRRLKTVNPNLKVLISVGGAAGSGYFTNAADAAHRNDFVNSCISQFIAGQFDTASLPGVFDGVDIDWEFPNNQTDSDNYIALLQQFRSQLDKYQTDHPGTQRLLLTSAISPENGPGTLQSIQFSGAGGAAAIVDFFNVMTYDYAGTWNDKAVSTAPLSSITQNISVLISKYGVPANKMVLGIPFYGVHYTGNFGSGTALDTLLSQASSAPVQYPNGNGTQDTDYISLVTNTLTANGSANPKVTIAHDADSGAWAYDSANALLWAYDDEATIARKAAYAQSQGLAGIMTWDISKDTAAGTLLCAMETGASGSPTPVCGSTPVYSDPTPGIVLFDFEQGDVQFDRTGGVFTVQNSGDMAYAGTYSLVASFITYRQTFQPHGTVWVTPPSQVQRGSTIDFHVWLPASAFANLSGLMPFFMDANWTWTSTPVNLSSLTPDAWNTLSVKVPANAVLPFNEMGLQFDSIRGWNGRIYIDTVTVR